jgi:hypothetical protein
MNTQETIAFLSASNNVDAMLKAFDNLCKEVTDGDLPILLEAIQSERIGFGVREWLAEPIIKLAGLSSLQVLLRALRMNYEAGHDNDSFQVLLVGLVEENKEDARRQLEKIKLNANQHEIEDINWLLEFS